MRKESRKDRLDGPPSELRCASAAPGSLLGRRRRSWRISWRCSRCATDLTSATAGARARAARGRAPAGRRRARAPRCVIAVVGGASRFNVAFIQPVRTVQGRRRRRGWRRADRLPASWPLIVGQLIAAQADRRRQAEQRAGRARGPDPSGCRPCRGASKQLAGGRPRCAVLEQVDQQRTALLRSVSHDLRTPLATIRAVATDLRDGVAYDDATRDELLDTGVRRGRAARPPRRQPAQPEPHRGRRACSPSARPSTWTSWWRDRVRRLGRLLRDRRGRRSTCPPTCRSSTPTTPSSSRCSPTCSRTPPATRRPASTVRIVARGRRDGTVEVCGRRRGRGHPPSAERRRVFEPFRRGEGSRSSGVGLAICRRSSRPTAAPSPCDRRSGGGATLRRSPCRSARGGPDGDRGPRRRRRAGDPAGR